MADVKQSFPDNDIKGKIKICDGVVIGTRAVVLPSCHYIGRFARVGAGAVVTKDAPDYAVVVGVPARKVSEVHEMTGNIQGLSQSLCKPPSCFTFDSYLSAVPAPPEEKRWFRL